MLLPPAGTAVTAELTSPGIALHFVMQGTKAEARLSSDLRLERINAEGDEDNRLETSFEPGPQGLTLISVAVGEDGQFKPGNRIIASYTYQTVEGFRLPDKVVLNRESHREVWHYSLTGCSVVTAK